MNFKPHEGDNTVTLPMVEYRLLINKIHELEEEIKEYEQSGETAWAKAKAHIEASDSKQLEHLQEQLEQQKQHTEHWYYTASLLKNKQWEDDQPADPIRKNLKRVSYNDPTPAYYETGGENNEDIDEIDLSGSQFLTIYLCTVVGAFTIIYGIGSVISKWVF